MILESREVTKKYGSKTAVNQVSLQLEPGLVYAMLGPNGSGKSHLDENGSRTCKAYQR